MRSSRPVRLGLAIVILGCLIVARLAAGSSSLDVTADSGVASDTGSDPGQRIVAETAVTDDTSTIGGRDSTASPADSASTSQSQSSTSTTKPVATTTTTTAGAATPGQDLLADAIPIDPGQSIQSVVDSNPGGTSFVIKAGVHRRQTVNAKDHQRFVGEPGAILDGEFVAEFAFQGGGKGVIIEGLVIRRYANPLQTGVLRTSGGATDWIVRNNEITENNGAAVYANHGWRVSDNHLHHNGQAGIFAGGRDIIIEGNEISYNNTGNHDPGWEAGGSKFLSTTHLVVRNNHVHNNRGPGLWTDWDNIDTLYENNTVRDNFGPGIFHEASFDAVIRNNLVEGNGFGNTPWLDGAGILLNTSQNVEIVGNTLRNNNDGIGLTYTDRGTSGTYGPRQLRNVLVRNNTVVMSSGQTGIVTSLASNDVFSAAWGNRFQGNDYTNNTGSGQPFAWGRMSLTWDQWRSAGHDHEGSFR